jgi:putative NIF3 family GTP cyclohydrolase 1 type 2
VRIVDGGRPIETVACVPGSGASYIDAAANAGIDCLVTGDIKHHDALKASARGLSLVDVTHVATENATLDMLSEALGRCDVEVTCSQVATNPFLAL